VAARGSRPNTQTLEEQPPRGKSDFVGKTASCSFYSLFHTLAIETVFTSTRDDDLSCHIKRKRDSFVIGSIPTNPEFSDTVWPEVSALQCVV